MEIVENFNFTELKKYLKTPKSLMEIQEHFKIPTRLASLSIINSATYRMLIYETDKKNGIVFYGVYD